MVGMVVKSNDDLRQEVFAIQLIQQCQMVFKEAELPLWVRPYTIVSTGPNCGLIEALTDALSVDHLKKRVLRTQAAAAGKRAAAEYRAAAAERGSVDEEAAAATSAEAAKAVEEGTMAVSLLEHFERTYGRLKPGQQPSAAFRRAQMCFARSLAGYSLVSYLFLMKVNTKLLL